MGEFVSTAAEGQPQGAPGGAQGGATPPAMSPADLSSAAAKLGVTVHELEDALADGPNSNPETVAAVLGVSVADLNAALPPRPEG